MKPEARLDKTDADYVQVIHTDGDTFGLMEPIGHGKRISTYGGSIAYNFIIRFFSADFYPNGGKQQPVSIDRVVMIVSQIDEQHFFDASRDALQEID